MGKRTPMGDDGAAAYRKRQKVTHDAPAGEDVHSGDQLRKLLAFNQDMRTARHGLQSFKNLLDEIIANDADRDRKLAIVRAYLQACQPRETGEDAVFLNDIMEMWSFASQVNDDGVMSAVVVVLALLLQVVSDSLELVSHGLGVCQTLLQERQLKSLSRNLSAEKGKGFIISPTLRLLREAVCLDGGAYAKRVFRARASTFASLGRNLEIVPQEGRDDIRKASVRTHAVRFFLSCLKFLSADGKKELLAQKELLSHLTFMMKNDPPYLVLEILDSLKTNILMDPKVPRDAKFRGFNTKTLVRFLGLYTYTNSSVDAQEVEAVVDKAHQFLTYICTNSTAGVLYPSKGLYPKDSDEESMGSSRFAKRQANEGNLWGDKFRDGVPVFNFVLSEFVGKLRPWSNIKHNELLVSIFKAAPELIADYFFNNRSFTFEPKLSMTWIGYAAFLFNTMSIPIPASFGDASLYANTPPPTSIILDNVIPQPINQKVLIRCLSPKSHLTSFFATRILVLALEKLTTAVKMLEEGSRKDKQVWKDASRRLVDAFCQRIPDMKEVVRSYKGTPVENVLHRTLASRLLRLYYEVVPRVALAANFDVSPFFVDTFRTIQDPSTEASTRSFGVMELENLVSIASYSPGMRWFVKVDNIGAGKSSSVFTALLQLLCDDTGEAPLLQLQSVLAEVAIENQLVSKTTRLSALLRSLRAFAQSSPDGTSKSVPWAYLDNCINRCATSPIKYLEQLESAAKDEKDTNLSLLNVVLQEQLAFAVNGADKAAVASIGKFLSLYFNALTISGESKSSLKPIYEKICESLPAAKMPSLGDKSELKALKAIQVEDEVSPTTSQLSEATAQQQSLAVDEAKLEEMLHVPFANAADDNEDTSALTKWTAKNVEDLVEDGHAAALAKLLSSSHTNIRKEALTNILKMAAKVKESSYEEKEQIWLLLSELAESSRPQVDAGPVPSAFVSFTVHALDVLKNPLHPLYPKVNSFLTRGPAWAAEKLPMAHDILHGEPSEDDRYYTEVAWLLSHLLDSLRTPFDLGVFHRKRWFEKVLSLGGNPYLRANLRTRVLRIVYRATCIEGGSTTLVTRFGLVSWLDGQRALCQADAPEDAAVYAALLRRAWETCDQGRVQAWSKGGVRRVLDSL